MKGIVKRVLTNAVLNKVPVVYLELSCADGKRVMAVKDQKSGPSFVTPSKIEPGDTIAGGPGVTPGVFQVSWFKAGSKHASNIFETLSPGRIDGFVDAFPSLAFNSYQVERLNGLARLLYNLNKENGADSEYNSTYGHVSMAIKSMVLNAVGVDLTSCDTDWGATASFIEDLRATVRGNLKTDEKRDAPLPREATAQEVDVYPGEARMRLCGGPPCYDGKVVMDLGTTLVKFGITNAAGEHGIAVYEPNERRNAAFWSHNHWGPPNDAHGVKSRQLD